MYSYVQGNSRKEDSCCCLFAVLPECRFSIPAPISAALPCSRRHKLQTVCFRVNTKARSFRCSSSSPKSLLTFRGPRLSQSHIPFGRSFSFQFAPQLVGSEKGCKLTPSIINWELFLPFARKNFCKLFVNGGYNDKKSRYTAHQISGR